MAAEIRVCRGVCAREHAHVSPKHRRAGVYDMKEVLRSEAAHVFTTFAQKSFLTNLCKKYSFVFRQHERDGDLRLSDEMEIYGLSDEMEIYGLSDEMEIYGLSDEMEIYGLSDEMEIYEEPGFLSVGDTTSNQRLLIKPCHCTSLKARLQRNPNIDTRDHTHARSVCDGGRYGGGRRTDGLRGDTNPPDTETSPHNDDTQLERLSWAEVLKVKQGACWAFYEQ
ncbi:hypothetical protein KUCAC02_020384, partial [Chaenocephalus aceratus]